MLVNSQCAACGAWQIVDFVDEMQSACAPAHRSVFLHQERPPYDIVSTHSPQATVVTAPTHTVTHPFYKAALKRPDLFVRHFVNYGALVRGETADVMKGMVSQALSGLPRLSCSS